jgi:ubiquitin C-terminal hydrolase
LEEAQEQKSYKYKIKSYIVHKNADDSLSSGHYIACVEKKGKYYFCDDSNVIPYQEISKEEFFDTKDAYLIVLERVLYEANVVV